MNKDQPPTTDANTVTISRAEYDQLKDDSLFLEALRQSGVDNWDWFGDAYELYESWKESAGDD